MCYPICVDEHSSLETFSDGVSFFYALKSFLGYLEGTKKAKHTIESYRLDLQAFHDYLMEHTSKKEITIQDISYLDLNHYQAFLLEQGLKNNTQRRKILTVGRFFRYLFQRKKAPQELARKLLAPQKIERVPVTLSASQLLSLRALISSLPQSTLMEARNRTLLWTLLETGCLVSEVVRLRFDDWRMDLARQEAQVFFHSKKAFETVRSIDVSFELYQAAEALRKESKDCSWMFTGFNKFGSLGAPMTPRGVEIPLKMYAIRFGFDFLTPRTLRHSVAVHWFESKISDSEIQRRLGLRSRYAFRAYQAILISSAATTSKCNRSEQESEKPIK
jgi:site-specific recombinase XerD